MYVVVSAKVGQTHAGHVHLCDPIHVEDWQKCVIVYMSKLMSAALVRYHAQAYTIAAFERIA